MKSLLIGLLVIGAWMGRVQDSNLRAQDSAGPDPAGVAIHDTGATLEFWCGEQQVASYVYADNKILRPFFANLRTPDGIQVSRNFPPLQGTDLTDHESMHPGVWLAFGDISGHDFWRNKAKVRHVRFVEPPIAEKSVARFVEQKRYLGRDSQAVCDELFECTLRVSSNGVLIEFDSTFTSDREFYFGDQEEMGLGIRVATPITEKRGGKISDSEGRTGAKQVWGQASRWCDYSGKIGEQQVGITIFCHPDNFRSSWMHARDYGLIVANAFGRAAMGKGPPDKTVVRPGESLRLRYGVFVYQGIGDPAPNYLAYLKLTNQS